MRISAAIVLSMLIATPAMAVDIVSGSGAVVKNGAGLTVVNGDPCAGRGQAACLDREGDRRASRGNDIDSVAEPAAQPPEPMNDYPEYSGCKGSSCEG